MKFCIECGEKNKSNAKFCGNCGEPFESHAAKKSSSQITEEDIEHSFEEYKFEIELEGQASRPLTGRDIINSATGPEQPMQRRRGQSFSNGQEALQKLTQVRKKEFGED